MPGHFRKIIHKPHFQTTVSKVCFVEICLETAVNGAQTRDVSHTGFPLPKVICGQVSWAEKILVKQWGTNNFLCQDPPGKKDMNVEQMFYAILCRSSIIAISRRFPPSNRWLSPCFFQISWKLHSWKLTAGTWKSSSEKESHLKNMIMFGFHVSFLRCTFKPKIQYCSTFKNHPDCQNKRRRQNVEASVFFHKIS